MYLVDSSSISLVRNYWFQDDTSSCEADVPCFPIVQQCCFNSVSYYFNSSMPLSRLCHRTVTVVPPCCHSCATAMSQLCHCGGTAWHFTCVPERMPCNCQKYYFNWLSTKWQRVAYFRKSARIGAKQSIKIPGSKQTQPWRMSGSI